MNSVAFFPPLGCELLEGQAALVRGAECTSPSVSECVQSTRPALLLSPEHCARRSLRVLERWGKGDGSFSTEPRESLSLMVFTYPGPGEPLEI